MRCKIVELDGPGRTDFFYFFDKPISDKKINDIGFKIEGFSHYHAIRLTKWKDKTPIPADEVRYQHYDGYPGFTRREPLQEVRFYVGSFLMYQTCNPLTPALLRDLQTIDQFVVLQGKPGIKYDQSLTPEHLGQLGINVESKTEDMTPFTERYNPELLRHTGMKPRQMQPAMLRG